MRIGNYVSNGAFLEAFERFTDLPITWVDPESFPSFIDRSIFEKVDIVIAGSDYFHNQRHSEGNSDSTPEPIIEQFPLFWEPCMVFMGKDHALASAIDGLQSSDLAGQAFIVFPNAATLRPWKQNIAQMMGLNEGSCLFTYSPYLNLNTFITRFKGESLFVIPKSDYLAAALRTRKDLVSFDRINGHETGYMVDAFYLSDRNPATEEVLQLLRAYAEKEPNGHNLPQRGDPA